VLSYYSPAPHLIYPHEIFGGYPWFRLEDERQAEEPLCSAFPWSRNLEARTFLLSEDFRESLNLGEYVSARYSEAAARVPKGASRHQHITFLTQEWFMQTLLTRAARAGEASGLELLAPFADYRVAEYLWNVPWEMKCRGGVSKSLLREAFADLLPPELLARKKSPFPKTYNPNYTRLLRERMREILHDTSSPIRGLIDREKTLAFIDSPKSQQSDNPWFGQLMAAPQMLAYLIQVDYWLRKYHGSK
jgi:asparagine synthase (glutamine-hydrolysing)